MCGFYFENVESIKEKKWSLRSSILFYHWLQLKVTTVWCTNGGGRELMWKNFMDNKMLLLWTTDDSKTRSVIKDVHTELNYFIHHDSFPEQLMADSAKKTKYQSTLHGNWYITFGWWIFWCRLQWTDSIKCFIKTQRLCIETKLNLDSFIVLNIKRVRVRYISGNWLGCSLNQHLHVWDLIQPKTRLVNLKLITVSSWSNSGVGKEFWPWAIFFLIH